jgi:hypothetical protein
MLIKLYAEVTLHHSSTRRYLPYKKQICLFKEVKPLLKKKTTKKRYINKPNPIMLQTPKNKG